jgi:TrmH family RNA methyltransferase
VPTLLSPQNPRIERARALRTATERRERKRFIIEGPTLLAEALSSGLELEELYGTAKALNESRTLIDQIEARGVDAFEVPERVLARLADVQTPPGLLAVAVIRDTTLASILARPGPILLLAALNDPGNAGTLVRSAEAFGAAGVLFGRGGADPYSPKVVRAAMGSLFRLPVLQVEAGEIIDAAAAEGRPIVVADMAGVPLHEAHLPLNAIVAVGHERHGVSGFLPRWDQAVRIEQIGPTESLNAAVAGSLILYAFSRRRG